MRKRLLVLGLGAAAIFAVAAWAQYAAGSNYSEPGGQRWVVQGSIDVASGGDLDIESGGSFKLAGTAVTSTAAELNILDGASATAAEVDEYVIQCEIEDISTAQSDWVVAPHAGNVVKIYSVIDGAISGADAALSFEIGGTAITTGGITVANAGSAAGDVDSSTPTAANALTAGQAVECITDGASTGTVKAEISLVVSR